MSLRFDRPDLENSEQLLDRHGVDFRALLSYKAQLLLLRLESRFPSYLLMYFPLGEGLR